MQRQALTSSFQFQLTKFYRIWFSNDPNQALGIENELRFIRMRKQNKDKAIYFIYSRSALNATALRNMEQFCEMYAIRPVDFDTEIMPMLTDEDDRQLYLIARIELLRALRHMGGNLAAASDCLRLIIPVIEKFGIYSDFDVELNFNQQTQTQIEAQAPMLLNAEVELMEKGLVTAFLANTDFLAFACDREQPEKLSDAAIQHIRGLQKKIIHKYENPFNLLTLFHKDEIDAKFLPQGVLLLFQTFNNMSAKPTVYEFRQFIMRFGYPGAPEEVKRDMQKHLMLWSVTRMSGPCVYWCSYENDRPKNDRFTYGSVPTSYTQYQRYIELTKQSCVANNESIRSCVLLKNTKSERIKFGDEAVAPGVLADLSWTEAGARHKAERQTNIANFASTLQFFARKKINKMRASVDGIHSLKRV